jgi:hypothetical protein
MDQSTQSVQTNQTVQTDQSVQTNQTVQIDQSVQTAPRTIYLCEPKDSTFSTARRVIALTFRYDENGNIHYGASIYQRNENKDIFHKQAIRETSHARYETAPVHINMKDFDISGFNVYYPTKHIPQVNHTRKNVNLPRFEDVVKTIRKAMFTHGVSHRRQLTGK